jgi:hypothetical protein
MQADHFDFWRLIESIIAIASVFVPLWFANSRQNKKQHSQNLKRFDYLINEAAERPHHKHMEKAGILMAEGIVYSPRKFNGD